MIYSLGERVPQMRGACFVAPNATVIGSVVIGHDVSIWYNVVIRGDNDVITIGDQTNVQDASVLHVDPGVPLTLGRGVTVGHMAMLHGCTIGDGTLVGIKSVILNAAVVGRNCIVGANTLIAEGKEIPEGSLVLGSPGRVKRKLSDEEIRALSEFSTHYVHNAERFRREIRVHDGR